MKNASGHKGENECQQKKVNTGTLNVISIKHVTTVWEVSGSFMF